MQSWNNIVQTAMLGTGKKQLSRGELTNGLAAAYDRIHAQQTADDEERFLQLTALVANYRRCGTVPQHQSQLPMTMAPAEVLPYCSHSAAQLLKTVLEEDNKSLLQLWLELCAGQQQLAPPGMLPQLLDQAAKHKNLRRLVLPCAGSRGIWLAGFNSDWKMETTVVADEELWQTGTTEQRKETLQQVRAADAARGRTWLQAVWKQETANVRAELLQVLSAGLSDADLPWLEELATDKSQKVKDAAHALLSLLPASSVVQRYWQLLQQAVVLKKEKTMLGLSSKMVLQVQLRPGYDETIFKTGIEKTTADKAFTNEEWILYQLIAGVPPKSWETHFGDTAQNIPALFGKEKTTAIYLPAFAVATGKFKDAHWASLLADDEAHYYEHIVPLLEPAEREKYLLAHLDQSPFVITELLVAGKGEWSTAMTLAVFRHASESPYHYNRSFYSKYVHLFPTEVMDMLGQVTPKEGYRRGAWESMCDHITRLLSLKQQICQSFSKQL